MISANYRYKVTNYYCREKEQLIKRFSMQLNTSPTTWAAWAIYFLMISLPTIKSFIK